MKKILYLTNIEVPYRVRFFNELAQFCDLTVLYERENSSNRDASWAKSEQQKYESHYLHGIRIFNETAFSFGIFKEIFSGYDRIIVGCYNSPVQMAAILVMRLFRIPYLLNLDGEAFLEGNSVKSRLKRLFLRGADKYLVAGNLAAESLRKMIPDKTTIPYCFSSLTEQELQEHRQVGERTHRNNKILVVGQYYDYKGMDVALEAARMSPSLRYLFVGMGNRTELFRQEQDVPENVKIIPFLQKKELERAYQCCSMLVLPTRQECWGLVINEAASFGTPIVSTWGSGAAKEFLAQEYEQYLATPGDAESLYECIIRALELNEQVEYREYLLKKSQEYSIEKCVHAHVQALELDYRKKLR